MEHKASTELPPVPHESAADHSAELAVGAETAGNKAFEAGQGTPPAPQTPVVPAALPQLNPALQLTQQQPATDPTMPSIADDTDLIEKEWVLKAKEIVARTKHDPYEQNKEVERMKADYMKKRYNKDIKTAEA